MTNSLKLLGRIGFDGAMAGIAGVYCVLVLGEAHTRTNLSDAQTAKECRYPPVSDMITESHVRELERNDMVVIRNVLTNSELNGARQSAKALNATMDTGNNGNENDVRHHLCNVREGDTADHGDDIIHCIKLLRGIPYLLDRFDYSASASFVVPRQCQLARYLPDGSIYERHLD
eukprot:11825146-Ditylum_brightwellii.AAC.1